jgi:hypothetical protein
VPEEQIEREERTSEPDEHPGAFREAQLLPGKDHEDCDRHATDRNTIETAGRRRYRYQFHPDRRQADQHRAEKQAQMRTLQELDWHRSITLDSGMQPRHAA